jgi:hypothetical protein
MWMAKISSGVTIKVVPGRWQARARPSSIRQGIMAEEMGKGDPWVQDRTHGGTERDDLL